MSPGPIDTTLLDPLPPVYGAGLVSRIPMKRFGQPQGNLLL